MRSSIYLVTRQSIPPRLRALCFISGLAVGLLLCATILMLNGVSLNNIVNEFIFFVFFDETGLAQTVTAFIPLALVGLAASAAIKLRFWNIGVEGQMWMGAAAATWVGISDFGPETLRLPLMFLAAALAGTVWIGIPAIMKLRFGVNEIISTLLLTYVAFLFVQQLLFGVWRDANTGYPVSPALSEGIEQLAKLGWGNVHGGLWIALGAGALWWLIMDVSRFGYLMDAVGANPVTAKATGLPVLATIIGSVILSGGLAGVAGMVIVAGQEYRLTQHIAEGYTFSSIVIAFVARFKPIAVLVAAFIVGGVYTAGETLKVFYQLPGATVTLLESIILLALLISEFFARYRIGWRKGVAA